MHVKTLIYEFGGFRLDPNQRSLLREGEAVSLTPKAFDTLLFLVQNTGRVLEKDTLMKALWPESFVEEGNLTQNISILRKALGDDQYSNRFIETIPKTGYQFVAPVKVSDASVSEQGLRNRQDQNALGAAGKTLETDVLVSSEEQAGKISVQAEYWSRYSPFRGLQAFEPEDSWLFFGREAETKELIDSVHRSLVLAVVGDSGVGKSSLVRAGLVPALGREHSQLENGSGEIWRIALLRPSRSPFHYLAETLPGQLAPELRLKDRSDFIADCRKKFPVASDALRNAITALVNIADLTMEQARRTRILLVVDEFEELFTLTRNEDIRNQYIDLLLAASRMDGAIPLHLVLVIRSDFYLRCLDHEHLGQCLPDNVYYVPQMAASQLRESIEKRLALAGAYAEPGLFDSLLEDAGTEPANLALLEHALSHIWRKCGGFGRTLTHRAYGEIGRLRGPLGKHASQVYQSILQENRRNLVQKIFLELVQVGQGMQDTRRRVDKEYLLSLGDPDVIEQLLMHLGSTRLIATGIEGNQTFVEVSHEMLIRGWDSLREWVRENREELQWERQLYQAAKDWLLVKREDAALLRGTRLQQAEQWLVRHPEAHPLVREFLRASLTASENSLQIDQAQKPESAREEALKDFRSFSIGMAGLLLGAFGASWFTRKQ